MEAHKVDERVLRIEDLRRKGGWVQLRLALVLFMRIAPLASKTGIEETSFVCSVHAHCPFRFQNRTSCIVYLYFHVYRPFGGSKQGLGGNLSNALPTSRTLVKETEPTKEPHLQRPVKYLQVSGNLRNIEVSLVCPNVSS